MTISDIMDTRVMPSSRRYQAAAMTGPQDRRNVQRSGYVCPRGRRLPLPQLGAPDDPRGLTRLALAYLEALSVRGFTLETVRTYRSRLRLFLQWCGERGLTRVNEVTVGLFERYQRYLHQRRKPNGSAQGMGSQVQHLCAVQQFYRWLVRRHLVLSNPAADIELPKVPQQLPMKVLSAAEAERVLAQPRVDMPLGLRDRALLELLYSTGMRRTELRGLNVTDVDFARGVVRVHAGKGNKDRVVPIGERALQWLQRYLDDVRPRYLFGQQQPALWLNSDGARLGGNHIGIMVRDCIEQAEVNKTGSCHLFRHTAATLMLENGADIRFIQAMLGHASLQTTQIYTQVSVSKLKEVHNATHPTTMQHGRAGARAGAAAAASSGDHAESGNAVEPASGLDLAERGHE